MNQQISVPRDRIAAFCRERGIRRLAIFGSALRPDFGPESDCEAMSFARGRTRANLDRDRMLVLSLVKDIEIIGEAAYQTTETTRDELPAIPWADINLDVLWQTVQDDLPAWLQVLEPLLPKDGF